MRHGNKNTNTGDKAMKYFLKNNYGKIALFIVASGIMTGAYMLTQNMKAVLS